VAYLEQRSLLLDIWILLRTPSALFFDSTAR
jgi:lipopolysaccharide/colanic/teichoic acid biosynthesis glycosyltransferase